MERLKILVADSHEVMRLGITFILKCTDDFEVVGEAAYCDELLQKVSSDIDVVIMDVRLTEGCATQTCRIIKERFPQTKVIVLISPNDEDSIFDAISAGADGILPKLIKSEELTKAIRMVYEGKSLLDPSITSRVMDKVRKGFLNQTERKEALLNPQERRILALIAEGKTNKEIAQILMLSTNTIKNYVSGILSKLNFSNRAEAAAYAVRNNLMGISRAVNEGR